MQRKSDIPGPILGQLQDKGWSCDYMGLINLIGSNRHFPFISGLKAVLKHIFGQIQLGISFTTFLRHEHEHDT